MSMTERRTTETHCHCGADFRGSDHCPECGCEQWEAYCDHVHTHADTGERRRWTDPVVHDCDPAGGPCYC